MGGGESASLNLRTFHISNSIPSPASSSASYLRFFSRPLPLPSDFFSVLRVYDPILVPNGWNAVASRSRRVWNSASEVV